MNKNENKTELSRDAVIIRTSIVGIVANIFLALFKAGVGLLSNSIAVILDAVNNLSDAASSIITIAGTKLAKKEPDKKHPFGHGRVEYFSSLIISVLVLYAGITSLIESVKGIVTPQTPDYSLPSLVIIAVAVAVKLVLGKYVKTTGKKVNSDSLVNSGEDASLDAVISASTLVAALIFIFTHISLEAWLGAIISLIIIKSGFDMIRETLSRILGERVDLDLAREIKKTVKKFDEVQGVYDLVLNNYGPDTFNGSLHIEVPDTVSVTRIDELNREIMKAVYDKTNVILTAIGIYAINTTDKKQAEMREKIKGEVLAVPNVMQMHGFYFDEDTKKIRFDLIISFDAKNRRAVYNEALEKVKALYPGYELNVTMDTDFSEE